MDDLLKTLVLQAPNFVGFMVLSYVLTRYVIMPLMAHHETSDAAKDKIIFDLAMKLADCGIPSEHVNSAKRDFSVERSGASHEEKSELLT